MKSVQQSREGAQGRRVIMRAGMGQERKVAPSRFRQGLRGDAWPSPTDRCSKTLLRQPGQHPVTSCTSAPCCDCASLANRMRVRLCSRSHSLIALRFSFIAAVSCCESVARLCTALHCTCTYAAAPSPTTTLNDCVCHRNVDASTDGRLSNAWRLRPFFTIRYNQLCPRQWGVSFPRGS